MKHTDLSWFYDNVYLQPPEPSKEDLHIEEEVYKLSQDMNYLIDQDWFQDCIDWHKVKAKLANQVKKKLEAEDIY